MTPYGTDLFGNPIEPKRASVLAERFFVPPFSVLNAREGWWQDRKRAWISMGIKSEIGRGDNLQGLSGQCEEYRRSKGGYGKTFNIHGWLKESEGKARNEGEGTSIFDPVLTELSYRWFCPPGGQIIDPFAGGSVRGIVASTLGFRYWGCDLRAEQVIANKEQALALNADATWVQGDSAERLQEAPAADFVFSCPPYLDLERYSDDPRDLSTMADEAFLYTYGKIISACVDKLKNNRFACFVVGDVRAQSGWYRNFVSDTIAAFQGAGAKLYNEAILVTQVGSLPIRVTKQFEASRKLGKTHQNVLVFIKGDAKMATKAVGND